MHSKYLDNETLSKTIALRHTLHTAPDLSLQEASTAELIAKTLREIGCDEVLTGLGGHSIVACIAGDISSDRRIAFRAELDALPIIEESNVPWSSQKPNKMHACGHDGHMAMLVGLASRLCKNRDFHGRIYLIFQSGEENAQGAKALIQDGVLRSLNIQRIFAIHNMPGIEVGKFAILDGGAMASADALKVEFRGRGGHAAMPHGTDDLVQTAAEFLIQAQRIPARKLPAFEVAVISFPKFKASNDASVIPSEVILEGTLRALSNTSRQLSINLIGSLADKASDNGVRCEFSFDSRCPVTWNDRECADQARNAASTTFGEKSLIQDFPPLLGAEDFAYLLNEIPGCMIFLGNGDSAPLHNPTYDFCDDSIEFGVGLFETLAREKR